jgi:acyl carrier protein
MTRDQVRDRTANYIRRELLGDNQMSLEPDTPLLQWGILNSMNTARLLTFIREELKVIITPVHITGKHFQTLNTIVDLIYSLHSEQAA